MNGNKEKGLKPLHFLSLFLPFALGAVLYLFGFSSNSEKVLTLFLPIVWSIMFALGGAIIFLVKYNSKNVSSWEKRVTRDVLNYSFILILQTLFFLILGAVYIARDFLITFDWVASNLVPLSNAFDCAIFSFIVVPSVASVLVGAWCLYLAVNYGTESS